MPQAPIRVLHVDDEPAFGDLTATILERERDRFDVQTATSAAEGLALISESPPDCVVSDYDMPAEDGIEFLECVRDDWPDLPFILFTGKGSEEIASDAISAGVTDYLQKAGTEQYELLINRIENAVQARCDAMEAERQRALMAQAEALGSMAGWEYDPDTDHFRATSGLRRVYGVDENRDLSWEGFLDFYQERSRRTFDETVETAIEAGYAENGDLRFQRVDGETRVAETTVTLVESDNRGPLLRGVVRDVTEQHERRHRFQALFRRLTQPTVEVEYDTDVPIVKRVNAAFEETFGYAADEIVGDSLDAYIVPDSKTDESKHLNQQFHNGVRLSSREVTRKTANGLRRFLIQSAEYDDKSGEFLIYTDITERKQREQELERERNRYQSLFEHNPFHIWEQDYSEAVEYLSSLTAAVDDVESYLLAHPHEIEQVMDRVKLIDVNQTAVEYYEAPSKEALLADLDRVFTDETTESLAAELAAIAAGDTEFRGETVSQTFSGTTREELLHLLVPEEYTDDYSRVYVIGTDITERKDRERELERQNERLEEFTSVVSHDLRNPLQVAKGRLDLAREACDSPHLDDAVDAIDRSETLIEDLLTLARSGDTVGNAEPASLSDVGTACWQMIPHDDATLVIDSTQTVLADRERLRQLLENLFTNAVSHGGTEMTVTIGDLPEGFYVADDGVGIPDGERQRAFEAGYSTAEEGNGFGLRIVKRIATAHGWEIRVTSSTDGGARFEITEVDTPD